MFYLQEKPKTLLEKNKTLKMDHFGLLTLQNQQVTVLILNQINVFMEVGSSSLSISTIVKKIPLDLKLKDSLKVNFQFYNLY